MTPPRPLTAEDRARVAAGIAKAWPECCRTAGIDSLDYGVALGSAGALDWYGRRFVLGVQPNLDGRPPSRALSLLVDELEERWYLAVERDPPRVLGWAIADAWSEGPMGLEYGIARVADLDARDPQRLAYDDRVHAARMARLDAAAVGRVGNAKRRW